MNDTAPLSQGKIIVAALFGVIAALVAWVLFGFGWFAGLVIGVIVAIITAIVLMLGWREPDVQEAGSVASQPAPAPAAAQPVPEPAPVAEPAATPEPAEAAPEPTAEPAPAAKAAESAPADPVVKPSAKLAGQEELSAKKGEWKYDGPGSETEPATAPAEPASADPAPAADASKPAFLSAAREGGADDLKQIKGVGPKLEQTLHGMGIYHFDQIAGWGPSEQAWMDDNLAGFKGRASRDNWVEQAKVLAEGGATEFSAKVEKGGVY